MLKTGLGLGFSDKAAGKMPVSFLKNFSLAFTSALPDGFTLTRSGANATYRDSNGDMVEAAANVARFDHDPSGNPLGLLLENTVTNKCEAANANPVDLTGVSITNGIMALVDNATELAASGLDKICTSGQVFKFTNTSGTSVITLSAQVNNVNPHSFIVYARCEGGTGTIELPATVSTAQIVPISSTFAEYKYEGLVPSATTRTLRGVLTNGRTMYVILQHLEQNSKAQSVIVNPASGSQATRNRDLLTYSELDAAPWWKQSAGGIFIEHKPLDMGVEMGLFCAAKDSDSGNYHISQRILSTGGLDADYKSASDVLTTQAGSPLYDDYTISGVAWETGGKVEATTSRGMRYVEAAAGTIAETLDALYIGRSSKFYGYYTGHIKNLYVSKGKPSFLQAASEFMSENDAGIMVFGQSNAEGFDKKTSTGSNAGQVAIINELNNYFTTGRNFTSNMAIGGGALYKRNNSVNYMLEDDGVTPGPMLTNAIRSALAANVRGGLKFIYFAQGSSDVNAESVVSLVAGWVETFTQLRAAVGDIPVIIGRPFRRNDSADSAAGYERWNDAISQIVATYDWAYDAPNTKIYEGSWENSDPASDDVHMAAAGYAEAGPIIVRKGLDAAGETVSGPVDGPEISGAVRYGTTVTVALSHPYGITDFTPTSGIEGFRFFHGSNGNMTDTEISISAAVRTDATTITLTLASVPTGSIETLYYCYDTGYSLDRAQLVRGNDSRQLPLQVYKSTPDVLDWSTWDGSNDGEPEQVLSLGWGTGAILPVSNNKGVFLYSENLPGSRVLSSVVTESNKTATLGTPTELESTMKLNGGPSGVKLSETRFLYMQEEPTSNTLYLYLLDETGAEIASTTYLSGSMRYEMDAVKVTSTQVIIAYRDDSDDDLYLVSVDLTGDSFTFGTAVHVYTGTVSFPSLTMQTATRGLVFIHNLVFRFTLSGSTITLGSSTRIVTADAADNYNSGIKTSFRIDDNNAIVFLQRTQTVPSYQMAAVVITDDGSSFSKSSPVNISDSMGTSTLNGEFATELQSYISGTQSGYYLVGFQDDATLAAFAVVVEYDGSTPVISATPVQKSDSGANAEHVAVCLFGSGRGLIYWQDERDSVDHELRWCVISP